MKVALIGAFDRNNYGDILMPIVFKKYFDNKFKDANIEFDFYGLSKSKMEYTKGYNTKALKDIEKDEYEATIIVGGEVLATPYSAMYLNLQKNNVIIFIYKVWNKLLHDSFNSFTKKRLGGKFDKPWILKRECLNTKKIVYNTVGGSDYIGSKSLNESLKDADYISVRDEKTYENMIKIGLKSNLSLYPDSVVALSEVIKDKDIEENLTREVKENVNNIKNYIVVQINRHIGKNIYKQIVAQIEELYNKYKISCVLLPIGYAQGHEDHKILRKILKKVKTPIYMPEFNNVYDTIYIIRKSQLYCGTSLHGAITAISYEIPHIALTNKINKLNNFLNTWDSTPIKYTDVSEMSENIFKILQLKETNTKVKNAKNKAINLAKENYSNIYNIIING